MPPEWVRFPLEDGDFEAFVRGQRDRLRREASLSRTAERQFEVLMRGLRNDCDSAGIKMVATLLGVVDSDEVPAGAADAQAQDPPEPGPEPEPASQPEPGLEPASEPEPGLEPASEPEPGLEPASEPEPGLESGSEPGLESEPASESEPGPGPGPGSESELVAASMTIAVVDQAETGSAVPLTVNAIYAAMSLDRPGSADSGSAEAAVSNLEPPSVVAMPVGEAVKLVRLHRLKQPEGRGNAEVIRETPIFVQHFFVPIDEAGSSAAVVTFTTPLVWLARPMSELFDAMMETFEMFSGDDVTDPGRPTNQSPGSTDQPSNDQPSNDQPSNMEVPT